MSCGWTSLSCMRESMHAKIVFRAAQIRGGAVALAQALGVPLSEVQAWMRSERPVPERVFARLLDTIVEDTLRTLTSNCPSDRKVISAAYPSLPSAQRLGGGRDGL